MSFVDEAHVLRGRSRALSTDDAVEIDSRYVPKEWDVSRRERRRNRALERELRIRGAISTLTPNSSVGVDASSPFRDVSSASNELSDPYRGGDRSSLSSAPRLDDDSHWSSFDGEEEEQEEEIESAALSVARAVLEPSTGRAILLRSVSDSAIEFISQSSSGKRSATPPSSLLSPHRHVASTAHGRGNPSKSRLASSHPVVSPRTLHTHARGPSRARQLKQSLLLMADAEEKMRRQKKKNDEKESRKRKRQREREERKRAARDAALQLERERVEHRKVRRMEKEKRRMNEFLSFIHLRAVDQRHTVHMDQTPSEDTSYDALVSSAELMSLGSTLHHLGAMHSSTAEPVSHHTDGNGDVQRHKPPPSSVPSPSSLPPWKNTLSHSFQGSSGLYRRQGALRTEAMAFLDVFAGWLVQARFFADIVKEELDAAQQHNSMDLSFSIGITPTITPTERRDYERQTLRYYQCCIRAVDRLPLIHTRELERAKLALYLEISRVLRYMAMHISCIEVLCACLCIEPHDEMVKSELSAVLDEVDFAMLETRAFAKVVSHLLTVPLATTPPYRSPPERMRPIHGNDDDVDDDGDDDDDDDVHEWGITEPSMMKDHELHPSILKAERSAEDGAKGQKPSFQLYDTICTVIMDHSSMLKSFPDLRVRVVHWLKNLVSNLRAAARSANSDLMDHQSMLKDSAQSQDPSMMHSKDGIHSGGGVSKGWEKTLLALLGDIQENDCSDVVRAAAKEALQVVGDFTLEIVEETPERGAEPQVLRIQVFADKLMERCVYFRTMLSLPLLERQRKHIRIVTPAPALILKVIDYIYTNELAMEDTEEAVGLLLCAEQYGVDGLKQRCVSHLSSGGVQMELFHGFIDAPVPFIRYLYDVCDATGVQDVCREVLKNVKRNLFFRVDETIHWMEETPNGVNKLREVWNHFPEVLEGREFCQDLLLQKLVGCLDQELPHMAVFVLELLLHMGTDVNRCVARNYIELEKVMEDDMALLARRDSRMSSELRRQMDKGKQRAMQDDGGGDCDEEERLSMKTSMVAMKDDNTSMAMDGEQEKKPSECGDESNIRMAREDEAANTQHHKSIDGVHHQQASSSSSSSTSRVVVSTNAALSSFSSTTSSSRVVSAPPPFRAIPRHPDAAGGATLMMKSHIPPSAHDYKILRNRRGAPMRQCLHCYIIDGHTRGCHLYAKSLEDAHASSTLHRQSSSTPNGVERDSSSSTPSSSVGASHFHGAGVGLSMQQLLCAAANGPNAHMWHALILRLIDLGLLVDMHFFLCAVEANAFALADAMLDMLFPPAEDHESEFAQEKERIGEEETLRNVAEQTHPHVCFSTSTTPDGVTGADGGGGVGEDEANAKSQCLADVHEDVHEDEDGEVVLRGQRLGLKRQTVNLVRKVCEERDLSVGIEISDGVEECIHEDGGDERVKIKHLEDTSHDEEALGHWKDTSHDDEALGHWKDTSHDDDELLGHWKDTSHDDEEALGHLEDTSHDDDDEALECVGNSSGDETLGSLVMNSPLGAVDGTHTQRWIDPSEVRGLYQGWTTLQCLIAWDAPIAMIEKYINRVNKKDLLLDLPQRYTSEGYTALNIALNSTREDRIDLIALLLDTGASPNAPAAGTTKWTPLIQAITQMEKYSSEVKLLIDHKGVQLDSPGYPRAPTRTDEFSKYRPAYDLERTLNGYDSTPLYAVCSAHHLNMQAIALLTSTGAQVDATYAVNNSPLMAAAFRGHTRAVTHLIDCGADVKAVNVQQWTALHFAAFAGHRDVCLELIKAGARDGLARMSGRECYSLTLASQHASSIARAQGHISLADALDDLLHHGDEHCATPLHRTRPPAIRLPVCTEEELHSSSPSHSHASGASASHSAALRDSRRRALEEEREEEREEGEGEEGEGEEAFASLNGTSDRRPMGSRKKTSIWGRRKQTKKRKFFFF